jgi:hypothetical protein
MGLLGPPGRRIPLIEHQSADSTTGQAGARQGSYQLPPVWETGGLRKSLGLAHVLDVPMIQSWFLA